MKSNLQLFLIFIALLAPFRLLAQSQVTESAFGHPVKANQAILKVAGPTAAILQQVKQLGDADDFRRLSASLNLYVLHSKSESVAVLLTALKSHPSVMFVEPDYIVRPVVIPNDPDFSQQWSLLNTSTPGADIGATNAWAISTGSATNVVGVVDTGIDYTHPDLAANVWSAPSQFTVNLSWGQLTCPAGSHGYNAITRSCDPKDDNGHGTHVSGTIGAIGNNATGVAGVNWITRIMALKFLDSTGSGAVSDAVDAIEFALQAKTTFGSNANLRVFSNSWGGSGYSQSLLDEINKANTANALFVVAAGNSDQNNDTTPTYPAAYNAPNLVTVAATTSTDTLASFSNYGPSTVHLGAPGVNILSTWPNASYATLSGTSMATPHVAGAAMLLLSACNLSTAALKNALLANVDPLASLAGITVTGGRLDVNKAINSCAVNLPQAPSISASFGLATIPIGGSTSLNFTISNPNAAVLLSGISFTDDLPAGLVVANPNGFSGSCGGGAIAAPAGSGTVSLIGAMLPAGGNCTFSVNVNGMTSGSKNNTTSPVTSSVGNGNVASATLTVLSLPPAITATFAGSEIQLLGAGNSTTLNFTITNPNSATLTGIAFSDMLPAGLVVSTPNGQTGSCGGGTIAAVAASSSIVLSGATLPGATLCTFSVNVTSIAIGVQTNTTSAITAFGGTLVGLPATASTSVVNLFFQSFF